MSEVEKNKMFECPYAKGLSCNQKEIMCDRGKFSAHCMMSILRMINNNIEYNHRMLIEEGMQIACHVLLHKDFLKEKYIDCCTDNIKDEIIKNIEDIENEGK